MKINHRPIFDTAIVEAFYSNKDGVAVKYVCTSAPNVGADYAADIFYRETPHPIFGNRYFGLYKSPIDRTLRITNVDIIETLDFCLLYDEVNDEWRYSQHRHDYHTVGNNIIDGGRAYHRLVYSGEKPITKYAKIINGIMKEVE